MLVAMMVVVAVWWLTHSGGCHCHVIVDAWWWVVIVIAIQVVGGVIDAGGCGSGDPCRENHLHTVIFDERDKVTGGFQVCCCEEMGVGWGVPQGMMPIEVT